MAAKLRPLGEHAYPAFQLYCAAEDHLEAAKSMTVLSRELLLVVNGMAAKIAEKPRIMSMMFGYAARLSAELAGANPLFDRGSLPPLPESGPAGPTVAAVAPVKSQLCGFVDAQLARFAEVLQVPEPVWRGFTVALGVRLAERYGRGGRKAGPAVDRLASYGYIFRGIDAAYQLAPSSETPPATATPAATPSSEMPPATPAPAAPQTGNQVLDGVLAAVNAVLEPGERLEAGCDGKVTKRIPFLQNETGDWAVWHPHFVAVTNRRVLLFVMSFKPMRRGLAGVVLRHEAPRQAVTVARFKSGLGSAKLDLRFEDGTVVPVDTLRKDAAAKVAGLLAPAPR
ncbi:MAG: hypothetical protein ACRDOB_19640 [Streptosporangiaceae bacterium]